MTRPRTYASISKRSLQILPTTIKKRRFKEKLSTRDAAQQIGISHQTLLRIEGGKDARTTSLLKVFTWLDGQS